MNAAIGVDFGATGIKAALVDCTTGELLSGRHRIDTPRPATPAAVRDSIAELVGRLDPAPVGIAVPAVVQHGVVRTAANIDPSWIGTSLPELLDDVLGVPTAYLNDADAAGVAEACFGSARGHRGLVVVVTIGTGIGSALLHDGRLVPNAELGHLELDGVDAELTGSGRALELGGCDWGTWTGVVSRYLQHLESLLWPDLVVIGGGVASTPEHWFPHLEARTPLRLATHGKSAGLVGAAQAVATHHPHPTGVTS
ncbi:ROK family protein [Nocardioides maradonensis]